MNNLAVIDPDSKVTTLQPAVQSVQLHHIESALARWVEDSFQAYKVAEIICKTAFVPAAFKDKPAETTAAIMTCQEMRIPVMSGLRGIDIIQGTPAFRAIMLRAIVQSHGHRLEIVEQSETRVIVHGVRKGETAINESIWTIERARTMGLVTKPNWIKDPKGMLIARATSEGARLTDADGIMAMPYSSEELSDGVDYMQLSDAEKPKTRTRKAKLEVVKPPLPELDIPQPQPVRSIPNLENPTIDEHGVVLDEILPGLDDLDQDKYEDELNS